MNLLSTHLPQVLVRGGLDLPTAASLLRAYAIPASQYLFTLGTVALQGARAFAAALASFWLGLMTREVALTVLGCGCQSGRAVVAQHVLRQGCLLKLRLLGPLLLMTWSCASGFQISRC